MQKPLVSIITPCYNGEEFLDRYFESILAQTYLNLEVIFVNDGSTDRTEEIALSYTEKLEGEKIKFIYLKQENAGQAAALDQGLKLLKGQYFVCIDSDDEIMPRFIEKKVEFLEEYPEHVYCYGKVVVVNEHNPQQIVNTLEKRTLTNNSNFFEDVLFVKNVFFPGYMIKTVEFDRVVQQRKIYSGAGGQNAQLLLPLAWYFGEPGYVEESIYKYYIRNESHSHSQKTSELIIQQLYNYEKILISTLQRISDVEAHKYIIRVKRHYSKLRFGNAIDTKQRELIRKHYLELRQVNAATKHDWILYIKYTNRVIRRILCI